jgi:hypothetical protein
MITDQPVGRAVLYVCSNVRPEVHDSFSNWCDSVHHFDTMRIEGFLSLRRFELEAGSVETGVTEYRLLTLYQIAEPEAADFSTPAYRHHTATYVPPPPGVVDGIEFERHILVRRADDAVSGTQPVGEACISLTGAPGAWLDDAATLARRGDGVLSAYRVDGGDMSVLLVDLDSRRDGPAVLSALDGVDHGGARRSLQLFAQVYPQAGVLGRDRTIISPTR